MIDSPADSLYYLLKTVFSSSINDENPQIQSSLNELEEIIRKSSKKSSSIATICQPKDEIRWWIDVCQSSSVKTAEIDRAKFFLRLFEPIRSNLENFEK